MKTTSTTKMTPKWGLPQKKENSRLVLLVVKLSIIRLSCNSHGLCRFAQIDTFYFHKGCPRWWWCWRWWILLGVYRWDEGIFINDLIFPPQSVPGVGGGGDDDSGETKEEQAEQERLRQEAIKQAEKERREKYKKQEDEREVVRQSIREKVTKIEESWMIKKNQF